MDVYGPPLPPGFKVSNDDEEEEKRTSEPAPKMLRLIGPQYPSFLAQNELDERNNSPDGTNKRLVIGPSLPESFRKDNTEVVGSQANEDTCDDKEIYGPMPPVTQESYDIVSTIEKRAKSMKQKLDMKDTPVVKNAEREEWMVVPDTSRKNQLGAISRCLAPGSKVSKKETHSHRDYEEDKKTTEKLKKYNESKRSESLLHMHREKKKKKDKEREKEKGSKDKERKAFDRDEMSVRFFTKKQVDSVIDKAKYLNSRFAPGRSQQYL